MKAIPLAIIVSAWASLALADDYKLEDGTLLFLQNSSPTVKSWTNSSFTHVAVVMSEDGVQYVYNAEPPIVKRYLINEYLNEVAKLNEGKAKVVLSFFKPNVPYSEEEIASMKKFLDDQINRRYSIRGYLRNIPGDGIHCAELTSGAIEATGRKDFSVPNFGISPGKLKLLTSNCHQQIGKDLLVFPKEQNRRSRVRKVTEWCADKGKMCQWSCLESLFFCW